MILAPSGTTNELGYPIFELISCGKISWQWSVVWPSSDFRAIAYKFRAFFVVNEHEYHWFK